MRQKFTITESERNQIRGLYEQVSTQPQQSGTTSPQSGTTIQTGTTTQSQFKSSHLSQHNTIGKVTRGSTLVAEIDQVSTNKYRLSYLTMLEQDKEIMTSKTGMGMIVKGMFQQRLNPSNAINRETLTKNQYNVIYFEGDSDLFKELNQLFKTQVSAPKETIKEFNLDNNVITLITKKLFGISGLRVQVKGEDNKDGEFELNSNEIDKLFPITTSQQPVNEQHEIDGEGMNQLNESNTGNIFEPIKDGVLPDGSPYKLFEKKYDGFKLAMVQATKTNKEGNKEILIKCILILPNNVKIDMTVEEFNQDWIRPKGVKDPMVHKLINNAEALGEYKVSMSRVPKMK